MDFNEMLMMMLMGNNNAQETQFEEIRKLDHLLIEADIPHKFVSHMGGYQITYFGTNDAPKNEPGVIRGSGVGAVCSAIENSFSYGHENDRIEISGLLTDEELQNDSVVGNLTAEDVFERIQKHWISVNE